MHDQRLGPMAREDWCEFGKGARCEPFGRQAAKYSEGNWVETWMKQEE
jgi:hypothetical protein